MSIRREEMSSVVPSAAYYGAVVIDDSGRVLMRKKAHKADGYFYDWKAQAGIAPEDLVRLNLEADFGVKAEIVKCADGIGFCSGGSHVCFILRYLGGDFCEDILEFHDVEAAWLALIECNAYEFFENNTIMLSTACNWLKFCKRRDYEAGLSVEELEWFHKFDRHCDDVENALTHGASYAGEGYFSDYIQSIVSKVRKRLDKIKGVQAYLGNLFRMADAADRSEGAEKALVESIHVGLVQAFDKLENKDYDGYSSARERTERYLSSLRAIYSNTTPEKRRRATVAARAKADMGRRRKSVILEVIGRRAPFRRSLQPRQILDKVIDDVKNELNRQGINTGDEASLRQNLLDILTNEKLMKKFH